MCVGVCNVCWCVRCVCVLDSVKYALLESGVKACASLTIAAARRYKLCPRFCSDPEQVRWYEGPHMLKCLAALLTYIRDPRERDAFVRIAEQPKIVQYLVDKVRRTLAFPPVELPWLWKQVIWLCGAGVGPFRRSMWCARTRFHAHRHSRNDLHTPNTYSPARPRVRLPPTSMLSCGSRCR
jgi:hypothetical protein